MTLRNCQILLKHYNELVDGTITAPVGHKDWADVVDNAKVRAKSMEERVARYNSDIFKNKYGIPLEKPKEIKPKEKKDVKKST